MKNLNPNPLCRYFLKFLVVVLALGYSNLLSAQIEPDSLGVNPPDTTTQLGDTLAIRGDIETTIVYYAEDSIIQSLSENIVYLYGNAKINYGDIELKAAQIEIDQNTNIVTARGIPDSTGRLKGYPVFTQGTESYEADSMRYNFKTRKGLVKGIVTEQGEGFLQSGQAKRLGSGVLYASGNKYTTCNLKHPHWYISTNKIKLIPDKQVVTGPFNMVIADVPTPVGFAFGIFPFTDKRRSGIIFPIYGESADRGFFLRNGGYYWYINDYVSAEILGEIYTNGSWGLNNRISYTKRYRYSGSASVRLSRRIQGDEGDETIFQDFWINWAHTPTPRGRSSFSASVNFGTSRFNERNSFDPDLQITNNFTSNINYRTSFDVAKTPVNLSLSVRHDQNSRTEVTNLTAPDFNLSVNRIYPFKSLIKGNQKFGFLKKLSLSYNFRGSIRLTNSFRGLTSVGGARVANAEQPEVDENGQTIVPDFFGNFGEILENAQVGGIHNIPITTTIKLLRYFSLNPSFNYQEAWYTERLRYEYAGGDSVFVITEPGFSRAYAYSTAASLTTRIYGIFNLDPKAKGRFLQGIRHTIIPTFGVSYRPDFSNNSNLFQQVQINEEGDIATISRFQGFQPGSPATTGESGVVTFSVQNVFEAKVLSGKDSAAIKKITLLDNLSFNGSYNIVADSFNLSNIGISARTRLLEKIDFNFTGTLDPYEYELLGVNDDGSPIQRRVDRLLISQGRGLGQLVNMNIAISASLTPKDFKKKTRDKARAASQKGANNLTTQEQTILEDIQRNPEDYVDFDIPWSLRASYNISRRRTGFQEATTEQQINFNGDLSITKSWKIGFRSGYDITRRRLSFTNININKDLHCWEMSFNWNPFGQFQSWNFEIHVKSSLLQDLKITRQRSFFDRDFIR